MKPPFFRRLLHPLCLVGCFFALMGFGASFISLCADLVGVEPRPYDGLLTFVLYPAIMFFGIALVTVGLGIERRRARRLDESHVEWRPKLDPKSKKHRMILGGLAAFALLFAAASIVGALGAYHYSESEQFCGQVCHTPMQPEFVAHQNSAHAEVPCVGCHVGPGPGGYMKAKLSGLRQLYQVLVDDYTQPIRAHPEAIPGSETTCERCHWRGKFLGQQLDHHVRFGYDLQNTRRAVRLVLETGGGSSRFRARQGIHWHANPENKVWFRATDDFLQDIPWVRAERANGTTAVYTRKPEDGAEATNTENLTVQLMGCRDCHNRPAHRFMTPDEAVDFALEGGGIERTIPFIKKVAVEALAKKYHSTEQAMAGIWADVEGYYSSHFKGAVLGRQDSLQKAIAALQQIYRENIFPVMNVNGYTYPDNGGHKSFPGCFRCHGGEHVSEDGKTLVSDCNVCHQTLVRSGDNGLVSVVPMSAQLLHPWKSAKHDEIDCWSCHAGKESPYAGCVSCHENASGGHAMSFECSMCHKPERPEVAGVSCAPCHPTGDSPLHQHADHRDCLKCHRPHTWKVAQSSCTPCHENVQGAPLAQHFPGKACNACHSFTGVATMLYGLPNGPRE